MNKLKCDYCNKEVERKKNIKRACCFSCRMERNRKRSNERNKKLRSLKYDK